MKKLNCNFAIVDVKKGRKTLLRLVEKGEKIPVTITGHICSQHSRDDGESIEFEIIVDHAEIGT